MPDIYFGTFNLNALPHYLVSAAHPPAVPVEISRSALARGFGSGITRIRHPEHIASIEGRVRGDNGADAQSKLDDLLRAIYNGEKALSLATQDDRYWLARLHGEPSITRENILYYSYSADFLVTDPMAYAKTASQVTNNDASTQVSGNLRRKTINVTPGGNAPAFPTYTLTISTLAGTSSITVRNTSLSPTRALTITRSFGAGNVVVINTQTGVVTVNGTIAEYSGQFPILDPRAGVPNVLQIDSQSTSNPTFAVTIDWRSRWWG